MEEKFFIANKQSSNYKQMAIKEFDTALSVLNDEIASLNAILTTLKHRNDQLHLKRN